MTDPPCVVTSPPKTTTLIQESEWLLDCECETPKVLLALLQSLSDSQHTTTFYCSPSAGLTIHTHPNPQFQCTLELPLGLFSKFHVAQECDFCVSYKTLLECLAVLTMEHPLKLCLQYHAPSEVLKLEATLKHGISSAAISGMVPPDSNAELSAAFGASPVVARLLCNSKDLQDWGELDLVSGVSIIRLLFQPNSFTGSVIGHSSQCQVVLPLVVDTPQGKVVEYSYPFQAWKRAMKPLDVAKETCLSINANGILAIQHQMLLEDTAAFCDCLLLPLIEEEEDVEGNNRDTRVVGNDDVSSSQRSASSTFTSTTRPSSRNGSFTRTSTRRDHHHEEEDSSTIASVATRPPVEQPLQNDDDDDDDDNANDDSDTDNEPSILPRRPLSFGTATSSLTLTATTTTATVANHRRPRKKRTIRPNTSSPDDEQEQSIPPRQQRRNSSDSTDSSQSSQAESHHRATSRHESSEILYCSSPEVVYGGD